MDGNGNGRGRLEGSRCDGTDGRGEGDEGMRSFVWVGLGAEEITLGGVMFSLLFSDRRYLRFSTWQRYDLFLVRFLGESGWQLDGTDWRAGVRQVQVSSLLGRRSSSSSREETHRGKVVTQSTQWNSEHTLNSIRITSSKPWPCQGRTAL
jgi:hypothetical protein